MSSWTFLFEFDLHGQSSRFNPIIIFKKEDCIGLRITVRSALDIIITNFKTKGYVTISDNIYAKHALF
jgi:hypothetical protein